jgi:hypothetical protein
MEVNITMPNIDLDETAERDALIYSIWKALPNAIPATWEVQDAAAPRDTVDRAQTPDRGFDCARRSPGHHRSTSCRLTQPMEMTMDDQVPLPNTPAFATAKLPPGRLVDYVCALTDKLEPMPGWSDAWWRIKVLDLTIQETSNRCGMEEPALGDLLVGISMILNQVLQLLQRDSTES